MQASDTPSATPRLLLRNWKEADRLPFRALNTDPRVMAYSAATLSEAESDEEVDRIIAHQNAYGFSLWAVELQAAAAFIGYVGLSIPPPSFPPCIEIGWRLAYNYWGYGYATEAAQATLAFAFQRLRLDEIVAFTAQINLRSQRVMRRLGMRHSKIDDFRHPTLPLESPLSKYVLYRLTHQDWLQYAPTSQCFGKK